MASIQGVIYSYRTLAALSKAWTSDSYDDAFAGFWRRNLNANTRAGFGTIRTAGLTLIVVPHWFLVVSIVMLGAAPWIRRSFSLRTLLIATTLIAAVLGLAVYFAK
jgi:hypothetical protein